MINFLSISEIILEYDNILEQSCIFFLLHNYL